MKRQLFLFAVLLALISQGQAQTSQPLTLIQTIEIPNVSVGPYTDQLGVDVKGHRLFATMLSNKTVAALDIERAKLLQNIPAESPYAVLYRSDLDQIYVTDGEPGLLRIFNGRNYQPIKSVKLPFHAGLAGYDPEEKYLYIISGGTRAKLDYSLISAVDTTASERMADIKIPSGTLEAMVLEHSSPRLYVNMTDTNQIGVVDRQKRTLLETWPITKGQMNYAITLDEAHHRLFVGCRTTEMSGVIVAFDTQTGKEIKALPTCGWVDYMAFDPRSGRIYATCGTGYIDVYQERDPDTYVLLGKVETALMAKTGLLVPELNRFFVSVPNLYKGAKVLVFRVQ